MNSRSAIEAHRAYCHPSEADLPKTSGLCFPIEAEEFRPSRMAYNERTHAHLTQSDPQNLRHETAPRFLEGPEGGDLLNRDAIPRESDSRLRGNDPVGGTLCVASAIIAVAPDAAQRVRGYA